MMFHATSCHQFVYIFICLIYLFIYMYIFCARSYTVDRLGWCTPQDLRKLLSRRWATQAPAPARATFHESAFRHRSWKVGGPREGWCGRCETFNEPPNFVQPSSNTIQLTNQLHSKKYHNIEMVLVGHDFREYSWSSLLENRKILTYTFQIGGQRGVVLHTFTLYGAPT